jgi:hypothetical protein
MRKNIKEHVVTVAVLQLQIQTIEATSCRTNSKERAIKLRNITREQVAAIRNPINKMTIMRRRLTTINIMATVKKKPTLTTMMPTRKAIKVGRTSKRMLETRQEEVR